MTAKIERRILASASQAWALKVAHILLRSFLASFVIVTFALTSTPQVFAQTTKVDLFTANDFAILAGSAITDTGTSEIEGDVGLSPTTGAAITGLACAEITGTLYDVNGGYTGGGAGSTACRITDSALLSTAKNDLITAYDDAVGRTAAPDIGTQLGGTTLTDGTYHAASGTFAITGTLTLDGLNDPDSVFIFKTSTTLITAASSQVVLINGAQACNVFWQVGSSATLGSGSTFVGDIAALTSISDEGSSTVAGRLLARNGAVTLINTSVTAQNCLVPSPAPSPIPSPSPTPQPSISPSPTVTAIAAQTANAVTTSTNNFSSSICEAPQITVVPIIIDSKRVSPTSIQLSWGPYTGTDSFNVRYGLVNGEWPYNTNVTGFSTTLSDLPFNQSIWVQVAARNICAIGSYSQPKFIGAPSLPNTGFAPPK